MLVKCGDITSILELLHVLSSKKINIETQYKLIKLKKLLTEEQKIFQEQMHTNCDSYFEKDNTGQIILNESGGIKIKEEHLIECKQLIDQLMNSKAQIMDIYFSLDELKDMDLTMDQLELLYDFIK